MATKKWATIQRIVNITPISGATNIECLSLQNGETVVEKKGSYSVGDFCIYFMPGAQVPHESKYQILDASKYVVTARNIFNQLSNGIVMKLTILPPEINIRQGKNVSAELNVTESNLIQTPTQQKEARLLKKIREQQALNRALDEKMQEQKQAQMDYTKKQRETEKTIEKLKKSIRDVKQQTTRINNQIKQLQEELNIQENQRIIPEKKRSIVKMGMLEEIK